MRWKTLLPYLALLSVFPIVHAFWPRKVSIESLMAEEIPRSWDPRDIGTAIWGKPNDGKTYVLAWRQFSGGDEECLAIQLRGSGSFILAHLYRHCDQKKIDWLEIVENVFNFSHRSPQAKEPQWRVRRYCHWFRKRPCNNHDIYACFADEWTFKSLGPLHTTASRVCERTWTAVIGEAPTRFFEDTKE